MPSVTKEVILCLVRMDKAPVALHPVKGRAAEGAGKVARAAVAAVVDHCSLAGMQLSELDEAAHAPSILKCAIGMLVDARRLW